jgi:hypothetical protein
MRYIDEDTLRNTDVEFIIKQDKFIEGKLKDMIIGTQVLRTSEKIKILQLKKLIHSLVKTNHPWVAL